jgi:hypothetical protein
MKSKSSNNSSIKSFGKSTIKKSANNTPSPSVMKTQEVHKNLKQAVNDFNKVIKRDENNDKISPKKNDNSFLKNTDSTIKIKFFDERKFDIEEFLKAQTHEKIKCLICKLHLVDPLSCYKCSTNYCSKCIKAELTKHNRCPKCFDMIFPELMTNLDAEMIEELKSKEIPCPFNGCKDKYPIVDIRTHLELCIFRNLKSEKQKHVNKIICQDPNQDPLMRVHMLQYLKNTNSRISNKDDFGSTQGIEFSSKFPEFKSLVSNLNDHISKTILELAKSTKITNEKLKSMINS